MTDDIVKEALDKFDAAVEAEADNRREALDDIKFARLSEQWPAEVRAARQREGRPCLTINKLPAYIRQVVNDSRQNKPSVRIRPVDDESDPETAEVLSGLVRNIEYTSNADIAYDTAIDNAVTCGIGYWRVDVDYAHDDTFDMDLRINRIANPFSVYSDPQSAAADSSDWSCAFVVTMLKKEEFKAKYKGADASDWETDKYADMRAPWMDNDYIQLAEYWNREEIQREIVRLSTGQVMGADVYAAQKEMYDIGGITVVGNRQTRSYKVAQYLMSGAEVLETTDWAGKYIPIVPVYGEEVNIEGKRYLRSLVRDAKDPARMFNYWRTASTELVALAPKAPFIGRKGAFDTDVNKWASANTKSYPYIEYDGPEPPQRQPFAGVPAGALQEAMNSSDDMKAVMGMFDPSMGARSNETSGKAIIARQRESDTGTFHFIDNLSRSIRHTGRILIDLIPHIYTADRVIRVLGEDGKEQKNVRLGQKQEETEGQEGKGRIYDLSVGKYDVSVDTGTNYTTKRVEAAEQMTEMMRVYPDAAPLIADLLATNLDWPGADDIAARFKAMLPPQIQGINPESQQLQGQIQQIQQQAQQAIQQLQEQLTRISRQNQQLQDDKAVDARKLEIDAYNAETNRLKVVQPESLSPEQVQMLVIQTLQQLSTPNDLGGQQQPMMQSPQQQPEMAQPSPTNQE